MSEAFPAAALPVPLPSLPVLQKQASGKMLVTPRTPKATRQVCQRGEGSYQHVGRADAPDVATNYRGGVGGCRVCIQQDDGERLFNTTAPNTPRYNSSAWVKIKNKGTFHCVHGRK